jgi:hypothetical protein
VSVSWASWSYFSERRPVIRPRQGRACLQDCRVQAKPGARTAEGRSSQAEVSRAYSCLIPSSAPNAVLGEQIRHLMPQSEATLRLILTTSHLSPKRSASRRPYSARSGRHSPRATDAGERWWAPTSIPRMPSPNALEILNPSGHRIPIRHPQVHHSHSQQRQRL